MIARQSMSDPTPGFDSGFSTAAMTSVFSPANRIGALARVEGALARAVDAAGMMPAGLAAEIVRACTSIELDAPAIITRGWEVGSPVMALLEVLRSELSEQAASWIHHGATTQDVVDTGAALLSTEAIGVLLDEVVGIARILGGLAAEHRSTRMPARTFLQDAGVTTFGLRCAQWLSPVLVHLRDLNALEPTVQLGGPNGTTAALGPDSAAVTRALATDLGLGLPLIPWHTDRTELHRTIGVVQRLAVSMAKTAGDIVLLTQPTIAEIRVRAGGSSSMPWKRNPIDAIRAIAAAEVCVANAMIVLGGPPQELERAAGAWHAEWFAVPVVFQTASAAVEGVLRSVESLEVDGERMAANLGDTGDDSTAAADTLIDRVLEEASRVFEALT